MESFTQSPIPATITDQDMMNGLRSQYLEFCDAVCSGFNRLHLFVLATVLGFTSLVHGQDPILGSIDARKTLELLESDADYRREMSRWDVFLYDVEMGTERRLTNSVVEESSPDLSEDGSLLAFNSGGVLRVLDLQTGRYLLERNEKSYSCPLWISGKGKIVVHRSGEHIVSTAHEVVPEKEFVAMNPDGTGEEILQDQGYAVSPYRCHPVEPRIVFVRKRISDSVKELCLMTYGENQEAQILLTFEEGEHASSLHWMPGGEELAMLQSIEGIGNTMFGVNIHTGSKEELFRAGMNIGNFDLSYADGRVALSESALHFDENYTVDPRVPEVLKVAGYDVRWYLGEKFILYRDYRLPEGLIERLKKGISLPDDRMYVLLEGGGVGYFNDPDDEHGLYVKEEKVHRNGIATTVWVDLSLEEAQAYVDLYDPGVILGPNGPDLEKGQRPKIMMEPARPVYD